MAVSNSLLNIDRSPAPSVPVHDLLRPATFVKRGEFCESPDFPAERLRLRRFLFTRFLVTGGASSLPFEDGHKMTNQ
jgi:hypothetical protein